MWLVSPAFQRQYMEQEYFRVRDPGRSYVFVQDVTFHEARRQATVDVVVYLGRGNPTAKHLTLHKVNDMWKVSSEIVV